MRILSIPHDADQDPDAIELLRAWIIHGELNISLAAWVWKDEPETWGRLLAEAAGHLADAISKETGRARDTVFDEIRASVSANLDEPDDSHRTGDFVEGPH
jgi:predicted lipid carrier protein YhbT